MEPKDLQTERVTVKTARVTNAAHATNQSHTPRLLIQIPVVMIVETKEIGKKMFIPEFTETRPSSTL